MVRRDFRAHVGDRSRTAQGRSLFLGEGGGRIFLVPAPSVGFSERRFTMLSSECRCAKDDPKRLSRPVQSGAAPESLAFTVPTGLLLALAFAVLLIPGSGVAQGSPAVTSIGGESSSTCALAATRTGALGSINDPALLTIRSQAVTDSSERVFVAPTAEPGRMAVYDWNGSFVRLVGRSGEGPGEFRAIDRVTTGPGDSIHVFDGSRWTLFPPGAVGPAVRTTRMDGYLRGEPLFLEDGTVVWPGLLDGRMHPFHLLSSDGARVHSFGWTEDDPRPGNTFQQARRVALALEPGRFWAARANSYRVEEWDAASGTLIRVLERTPSWFEPWEADPEGVPPTELTNPRLVDIAVDDRGRLWLLFMVPAEARAGGRRTDDATPPAQQRAQERLQQSSWGPEARERSWDTRIEVVDPDHAVVLCIQTFTEAFNRFESAGIVYRRIEQSNGVIGIERWTVEPVTEGG
jgi:hypothetical protein